MTGSTKAATAFAFGFVLAVATPSCGILHRCSCPQPSELFSDSTTCGEFSSIVRGTHALPRFGDNEPTITTTPTDVLIEYTTDGDSFSVRYLVSDD